MEADVLRKALTAVIAVGISLGTLTALAPAEVLAYPPCETSSSGRVSTTTVTISGGVVTFTVTIKDCSGNAVQGATVVFSATGPCPVTFNPPTAVTDANGQASSRATFAANCPGQYTLAGGTQGITVTAGVRETGGFPSTSADPPPARSSLPLAVLLLVGLGAILVAGGSTAFIRRRR